MNPPTPTAPPRRIARRVQHLRASLIGLGVLAVVIVLDTAGVFGGVPALVCAILVWVGLPSARGLSRRVALNGAIGLGCIPLLWWIPWPSGPVSHSGVILGVLLGVVAYRIGLDPAARRGIIPRAALFDVLPAAVLIVSAWFFLPFAENSSGVRALAMVRGAFGNDNVAHFDMFEMIRRYSTAGTLWPPRPGGDGFTYTTYPQHFHILVAFAAELWGGARVTSVSTEVGLFGIGSGLVLTFALVTLAAAVCSLRALRGWPAFGLVGTTACVSLLLIGEGGSALTFGFPGFLLAVIGTLIAVVLALNPGRPTVPELLAVGAAVVLVAHSWSLLTPIAGVSFLVLALRVRWLPLRGRVRSLFPHGVVVVLTAAGVLYAVVLVLDATSAAGRPDQAVLTSGAAPITRYWVSAVAAIAVLVPLIAARLRVLPFRSRPGISAASSVAGPAAVVGVAVAAGLWFVELIHRQPVGYFEFKYLNGLTLILFVLAPILVCIWAAGLLPTTAPRLKVRATTTTVSAVAAIVLLASAFVNLAADPLEPVGGVHTEGLEFRHNLVVQAEATTPDTSNLLAAASLMATLPCPRPIYIPPDADPGATSNQWAMSLSSTWTLSTGTIQTYLATPPAGDGDHVVSDIRHLLAGNSDRCVIVSPATYRLLSPDLRRTLGKQLRTWG